MAVSYSGGSTIWETYYGPVETGDPGQIMSAAEKDADGMVCYFPFYGCVVGEWTLGAAIAIFMHWLLFWH